jgi:hypothetical protein
MLLTLGFAFCLPRKEAIALYTFEKNALQKQQIVRLQ